MSAEIIIGMDGGGTGCRVAIVAWGQRQEATGGPANAWQDEARAVANLAAALAEAARALALDPEDLRRAHVHAGVAGILDAGGATRLSAELSRVAGIAPPSVSDDRETTLHGALGGAESNDGWLFSAGTGSFAGVRRGRVARLMGGWGLQLGDQASGAWLGRRALEAALLAHDRIVRDSPLLDGLMADFGADPLALVAFARRATGADYARFAPRVAEAADDDPVARTLMEEGAAYVVATLRALDHQPGGRICLAGGLGPAYARFLPDAMRSGIVAAKGTALDGALALAARPGRA